MLFGIFEEIPKWFFARIFRSCPSRRRNAEMAEWLMAADCKSALLRVRWFESSPLHQEQIVGGR